MQETGRITVVPVDLLDTFPGAVQEYIAEYFIEQNVLGRPCMAAFGAISFGRGNRKGVAPAHSSDLRRFKTGLDGKSLWEWLDEATSRGLVWRYAASWDDGCIEPPDD